MAGSVEELYQAKGYPPMSHPSSDPAVSAVAARFAGLASPDPSRSSILEIGCASGHNLLPLAARWPEARCVGTDIADEAVATANRRAEEAGISNARFIAGDLRGLVLPGETFDYIIAHGVFSWVDDDVKQALLDFCAGHLSPSGIAVISFNLMSGWENRLPVVETVRRIMSEHDVGVIRGLQILREVVPDEEVRSIVDDMLAKGEEILGFDDFAPVNDPWPLDRFAAACISRGLRWLGDSDPAENIPSSLGEEERASLLPLVGDPLLMQMTADTLAGSAFRSGVLCRHDAPVEPRMSMAMVLDLSVRLEEENPLSPAESLAGFVEALKGFGSSCVPVRQVIGAMENPDVPAVARSVFEAITRGHLKARIEPTEIDGNPAVFRLSRFNALCVREDLPLVDAWHMPCLFSENPRRLLAAIDGKTVEESEGIAASICPDLAFPVWFRHLASRGLVDFR
ncbi:MAG TPA: class I SAM-dependent methyltransferase [Luteolibacter sp.]|nr:class I SAM-dependent methyltransferase [Luteolibacter sp.]